MTELRGLHLSFVDEPEPYPIPDPDCPRADLHIPSPRGYVAWHEWAGQMVRSGARQSRCPGCGLYHVWTGRRP